MITLGKQVTDRSGHHLRLSKTPRRWAHCRITGILMWMAVCLMAGGWGCAQKSSKDDYLIRVGGSVVTVAEFKTFVEAASEEAFPGEQSVQTDALNDLRMRTLNQLTEELIISERAKQIGVQISETELEQAIQAVKADYPDDTFEKTLLENAVSFSAWKQKMATRMLVDKVIAKELVDKVEITSDDVSAYFQAHYPEGAPEGEDANQINKKIVRHLRQQKAEKMYQDWIDSLRSIYPADINQQQWNALMGDPS